MYGFTNDAGEPIMDGAAYRFEQQLDSDYASMQAEQDFYDSWEDEDEDVEPEHDDENSEPWEDEDGWLDGSYEE
jgi:hypothetical protein